MRMLTLSFLLGLTFRLVAGDSPPDYGCWQVSETSESCSTRCASLGGCSGEDSLRHKDEIDSHAEVKVLFETLTGQTCGSPTQMYTWDTVPLFYQGGNMHCMGKTGASSTEDFNCDASNSVAKRLCWCSSCASPPPFAPGAVPPSPPPPSYIKLQTDGGCQGWSIQQMNPSTPQTCQDLCDLSIHCGATTFFQSSTDNCTRPPVASSSRAQPSHAQCTPARPNRARTITPRIPPLTHAHRAPWQAGCTFGHERNAWRPTRLTVWPSITAARTIGETLGPTTSLTSRTLRAHRGADTAICASLSLIPRPPRRPCRLHRRPRRHRSSSLPARRRRRAPIRS